jgi:hypothetical protein
MPYELSVINIGHPWDRSEQSSNYVPVFFKQTEGINLQALTNSISQWNHSLDFFHPIKNSRDHIRYK